MYSRPQSPLIRRACLSPSDWVLGGDEKLLRVSMAFYMGARRSIGRVFRRWKRPSSGPMRPANGNRQAGRLPTSAAAAAAAATCLSPPDLHTYPSHVPYDMSLFFSCNQSKLCGVAPKLVELGLYWVQSRPVLRHVKPRAPASMAPLRHAVAVWDSRTCRSLRVRFIVPMSLWRPMHPMGYSLHTVATSIVWCCHNLELFDV